jgi:hypothetical protein
MTLSKDITQPVQCIFVFLRQPEAEAELLASVWHPPADCDGTFLRPKGRQRQRVFMSPRVGMRTSFFLRVGAGLAEFSAEWRVRNSGLRIPNSALFQAAANLADSEDRSGFIRGISSMATMNIARPTTVMRMP